MGGFELQIGDDVVDVQPAAQRLLALLALAGVALERSFAAEQLWPDTRPQRAQANLRSSVWRLRGTDQGLVTASKTHIRLGVELWVDVRDGFDQSSDDGWLHETHFEAPLLPDLLPDWYDDWLMTERERVRQMYLARLESFGDHLLAQGRRAEAIQVGLRAVAIEPLRETSHRLVIRCHLAEGNLVDAVRQYKRYAQALDRELATCPSPSMRQLLVDFGIPATRVINS